MDHCTGSGGLLAQEHGRLVLDEGLASAPARAVKIPPQSVQIDIKFSGGLVPEPGVLFEGLPHDLLQARRNTIVEPGDGRRFVMEYQIDYRRRTVAIEGKPGGEH